MASTVDRTWQQALSEMLPEDFSWQELDSRQRFTLLGGGALALFGLSRRSVTGLVLAGLGGSMAYRTIQDVMQQRALQGPPARGASTLVKSPSPTVARDRVDEASWESFPASDPPSNY